MDSIAGGGLTPKRRRHGRVLADEPGGTAGRQSGGALIEGKRNWLLNFRVGGRNYVSHAEPLMMQE